MGVAVILEMSCISQLFPVVFGHDLYVRGLQQYREKIKSTPSSSSTLSQSIGGVSRRRMSLEPPLVYTRIQLCCSPQIMNWAYLGKSF